MTAVTWVRSTATFAPVSMLQDFTSLLTLTILPSSLI